MLVGMEPWAVSPDFFEELEKSVRKAAQAVIDSALVKLKTIADKTLKVSSEIIQGPPRQVIVDEAESWGADLIVMVHEDWVFGTDCCWSQTPWSASVPLRLCGHLKLTNARKRRKGK